MSFETPVARHRQPIPTMRIAMLGAHETPSGADGLETAIGEIGRRLVSHGHTVTVYTSNRPERREAIEGMRLVHVPGRGNGLTRGALTTAHLATAPRHDVAFLFESLGSPFISVLRARRTAVALHVDGLEWQRDRHGRLGRRYSRHAAAAAAHEADALIADAPDLADAYLQEFAAPATVIGYGANILRNVPSDAIEAIGLVPGQFHLVVARFEADDRIATIADGYVRSDARLPLVIVGGSGRPGRRGGLPASARRDPRIRLLGPVDDQRLLDQLYAHALLYIHGNTGSGANPSLLRAMGAGTAVLAWDSPFNRTPVGTAGLYFDSPGLLGSLLGEVERYPTRFADIGELMQERARARYDWNSVAEAYEALAARLLRESHARSELAERRQLLLRSADD
ncbi:MAG: glycosyltransferase [Amnibacterium sp.]